MTRQEIMEMYDVNEQGVIKSPGKFEGEMLYVPYFWDLGLEGDYDFDEDGVFGFEISTEDIAQFPELAGVKVLLLEESDTGFVYSEERDELPESGTFSAGEGDYE